MSAEMHTRTVGGLMTYCDWLKHKGYQGASATESWKSAAKMVFETVEPDGYEDISLDGLDVDDYVRRFQTLAGAKLRAETVAVYGRRIKLAIEAHAYYLEHGKPPSFKRGTPRGASGSESSEVSKAKATRAKHHPEPRPELAELIEFPFPLIHSGGQIAKLKLPAQGIHPKDAERIVTMIKSLTHEGQRQIPERTGSEEQAAA